MRGMVKVEPKFGTVEFFERYLNGQLEKEVKTTKHEVIHRVFYAMAGLILEEFKGKEALVMLENLHEVTEKASRKFWKVVPYE